MEMETPVRTFQSLGTKQETIRKFGATHVSLAQVSFTWKIRNYKYLPKRKTGEKLLSPPFTAGDNDEFKFRMSLYPSGLHKPDQFSLFVVYYPTDEIPDVVVSAKYYIMNDKREICHSMEFDRHKFTVQDRDWGWPYFLTTSFFKDPKKIILKEDLTVGCDLYISEGITEISSDILKFRAPKCPILGDLSGLFDTMKFADVTLVTRGREFKAHKAILGMRSCVFSAMFASDMIEKKESKVTIEDVDDVVLEELLRFIYTGKVADLDWDMAEGLLVAADKYALHDLQALCEKALIEGINIQNAVRILIISDLHGCAQLKSHVLLYICAHVDETVETPDYKSMRQTHGYLIDEIFQTFAVCKSPKKARIAVETEAGTVW